MRLIVHAGLHKTGATYLQHVMSDNREALLGRGVHYASQAGAPGHDNAAWAILRRDYSALGAMVEAARAAGCDTTILSSQDLESLIFDRAATSGLEAAAAAFGVDRIEWHMCLRDPGDYFTSLHAQLQHHLYTDPAAMLFEILGEGMMLAMDAAPAGAPFRAYCFDHLRYISAFAAQTAFPVHLHDFADASPFPGWRLLDRIGVLDALRELPGPESRNLRLSEAAVIRGYCDQILRRLPDDPHRDRLRPRLEEQVRRNILMVDDYARSVRELFAPSTKAALQIFLCPREGQEPLRACA
jgi:hypothetical protein